MLNDRTELINFIDEKIDFIKECCNITIKNNELLIDDYFYFHMTELMKYYELQDYCKTIIDIDSTTIDEFINEMGNKL